MSDDKKFDEMIAKFDAEEIERRKQPPPRPAPKPGQVTVAELISLLQKMPQDAPVESEGCDCFGPASGAELYDDGTVVIGRVNGR